MSKYHHPPNNNYSFKSKLKQTLIYIMLILVFLTFIYFTPDIVTIIYVSCMILLLIGEWWTRVIREIEDDYD